METIMEAKMCALIRQTWFEAAVRNLSDPERLAFYEACFKYEFTGEMPSRQSCPYSSVLLMFDMVKVDLAADAEKARRIAERNRANGSLGGRPATKGNKTQQYDQNPEKPTETQPNPAVLSGFHIHNTTQHNTTQQAAAAGIVLDGDYFNAEVWTRLDPEERFRSRHRACLAMWLEFSSIKRAAIAKAVRSDVFTGGENPYFYLQDFAEPRPKFLEGKAVEDEWVAGRSVYQVRDGEKFRLVSADDVTMFGLQVVKELKPDR